MSEAKQVFLALNLSAKRQSVNGIEAINSFKGPKGDKGDTGAQGPKGDKGDKGDTGAAFTYGDFTEEQLAGLVGPKGDAGSVTAVNGKAPDGSGTVMLEASDIGYGDSDVGSSLSQLKDEKLDKTATAANSSKLGGKAPEYYLQPRNLLDNSDFRNPVNQRGQTSYDAKGYNIDRWRTYSTMLVSITSNGIACDATTTDGNFTQSIAMLPNGIYTFAAKVNGIVYSRIFEIVNGSVTTLDNSNASFHGSGYLGVAVNSSGNINVFISNTVGYVNTVEWAALYEGSYTADTLPPYVPKGYAQELAECRRYFRRKINALVPGFVSASSKCITISIENDASFVSVPTLTVTTITWIRGAGKNITTIPAWTTSAYSNNAISPVFNIDLAEAIDQTAYASVYVYCSYTLSSDL